MALSDPGKIGTTELTSPEATEWMDVQRGEMLEIVGLVEDQQTQVIHIKDTDKLSILVSEEDFNTLRKEYLDLFGKYETLKIQNDPESMEALREALESDEYVSLDDLKEQLREEERQQFHDVHGIESPPRRDEDV